MSFLANTGFPAHHASTIALLCNHSLYSIHLFLASNTVGSMLNNMLSSTARKAAAVCCRRSIISNKNLPTICHSLNRYDTPSIRNNKIAIRWHGGGPGTYCFLLCLISSFYMVFYMVFLTNCNKHMI